MSHSTQFGMVSGLLLMVLVLAKLAGMKSLLGASDWVRDQAEYLREYLHLPWKQMPCANTYKYALARLDSQPINEQFRDYLVRKEAESRCGAEPSRLAAQGEQQAVHVAIDGKGHHAVFCVKKRLFKGGF